MRDELPKFPTPSEAFGKSAPLHPPVSAYAPVNNIPKPPQPRYRQVSSGGEYHSSPSLPEPPHHSRPHSAGLHGSQQYTTSHPNLPQQRKPHPPHSKPMQRVPPQKVPPRVPVPQSQPAPHLHQQVPQNPPRQVQPPQQHRVPVQPQIPPKVPAQAYAPAPQQRVSPNASQQFASHVPPQAPQKPYQYQYEDTNRYPENTPMMSTPHGSGRSTPDSLDKVDLRGLFDDVDRHKRGYLAERELSKALVNSDYTLFDAHTVRLMMKMFDRDGDGCIYFAEFGQLWKYLHDWRGVFDRFDTSKSDSISFEEFTRALNAFGYSLSSGCIEFMFNAGSKLNRQGQRDMSFDMFVQSCISIKSITDTFKKYDTDRDGYVTMGFEDYLMETTKLH